MKCYVTQTITIQAMFSLWLYHPTFPPWPQKRKSKNENQLKNITRSVILFTNNKVLLRDGFKWSSLQLFYYTKIVQKINKPSRTCVHNIKKISQFDIFDDGTYLFHWRIMLSMEYLDFWKKILEIYMQYIRIKWCKPCLAALFLLFSRFPLLSLWNIWIGIA